MLAIYNLRGSTAIAFIAHKEAALIGSTGLTASSGDFNFNIRPHLWYLGIQQPEIADLYSPTEKLSHAMLQDSNSMVVWHGLKFLLLSKAPQYLPSAAFDYLVLTHNVPLKPEDLRQLQVGKVILDASNAPWRVQGLKKMLEAESIPYYDVAGSGAFLLDLK